MGSYRPWVACPHQDAPLQPAAGVLPEPGPVRVYVHHRGDTIRTTGGPGLWSPDCDPPWGGDDGQPPTGRPVRVPVRSWRPKDLPGGPGLSPRVGHQHAARPGDAAELYGRLHRGGLGVRPSGSLRVPGPRLSGGADGQKPEGPGVHPRYLRCGLRRPR